MLASAAAFAAVAFGALEVGLPAFAEARARAEPWDRSSRSGRSARWSAGSCYGARSWSSPASRRFLILIGLLGLGAAPLPFAGS